MISTLLHAAAAGIAKTTKIKVNAAEKVNESGLVKAFDGQMRLGIDDKNAPAFDLVVTGTARASLKDVHSCGRNEALVTVPVYLLFYGGADVSSVVSAALFALGLTYPAPIQARPLVGFTEDIRITFNYAEVWKALTSQASGSSKSAPGALPAEPVYVQGMQLVLFNFDLKASIPLSNCQPLCQQL